jgi:diguanylate cyclase (GGDEF)-like protein
VERGSVAVSDTRSDSDAPGLAAIIDAATGVLGEQSLEATLEEMARALDRIVPYTSLAIYEVDQTAGVLAPLYAAGRYIEQTMSARPALDASITGHAVTTGQLVHLEAGHPWLGQYVMPGTPSDEHEAFIAAPLMVAGEAIGSLNVWREGDSATFAPAEAQLLARFAAIAAMAYNNARQREQLRQLALTDELTGVHNRRYFYERLREELADASRHGDALALVVLDIDGFKRINDDHGHLAGDDVLRAVADLLCHKVREHDVVCRTGGEEFAVIAPRIDPTRAAVLAHRLVSAVATAHLGPTGGLTVSAGLALAPAEAATPEQLFGCADHRLLEAKATGKNRAVTPTAG